MLEYLLGKDTRHAGAHKKYKRYDDMTFKEASDTMIAAAANNKREVGVAF